MLATYLAGLAVGSALYVRYESKVTNPWGVFGVLIAAAGLVALAEIAFLSIWQLQVQAGIGELVYKIFGDQFARMCARFLVAAVGIVFIPTVLLGAAFPAALRLIVSEGHAGRDTGTVIALNTVGGIAGTLVTGVVLVPRLGLVRTLGVLAIAAGMVGIIAVLRGRRDDKRLRWVVVAIGVAALAGGIATPADRTALNGELVEEV